jgi:pimeloyl-ACP methyl ester carboxylesterase
MHEIFDSPKLLGFTKVELNLKAQARVQNDFILSELEIAGEKNEMSGLTSCVFGFAYDNDIEQIREMLAPHLHLYCLGTGQPTVILDAGLGDWSLMIRDLQQKVAGFTHVCAYDCVGYGWSDAGPQPRTTHQIVTELKTLLEKANVPDPYVLVGHSIAGFHLRLFAHEYPALMAGMVWIDTTPPDFFFNLVPTGAKLTTNDWGLS